MGGGRPRQRGRPLCWRVWDQLWAVIVVRAWKGALASCSESGRPPHTAGQRLQLPAAPQLLSRDEAARLRAMFSQQSVGESWGGPPARLHGTSGPRVLWFRGSSQLLDHGTSQGSRVHGFAFCPRREVQPLPTVGDAGCPLSWATVALWVHPCGLPRNTCTLQYLLCPLDGTASRPHPGRPGTRRGSPQHSDGQRPRPPAALEPPASLGSGNNNGAGFVHSHQGARV